MVAEKDIIVAFELGSSAIRGIAGRKEADGSIHILAIEQEKINGSIRRGTVYNINKTTSAIARIKDRLNDRLGVYITRAYVGIAGQSLHTASNVVVNNMTTKEKVTQEMVDRLMDENRAVHYTDREILEVAPQEYHLGIDTTNEPIGIQTDKMEGRFLNVIARTSLQENIRRCMREAGLDVVELLITPLEVAKTLLSDSEMRAGCALVDIGAETTTVAILKNNILRHLVTIPLGGKNVTNDIAHSEKVEMDEAEELKKKYGVALLPAEKEESPRQIHISNERVITEEQLQSITSARYDEIIANVWNQISKGKWEDELLSGITLTGGGAYIKGVAEAFARMKGFNVNKIKIAKELLTTVQSAPSVNSGELGYNAAIALLMQGNENCTGEAPAVVEEPEPQPIQQPEIPVEPEPEPEPEKKEEPKKTGPGLGKRFGNWLRSMVTEEDE